MKVTIVPIVIRALGTITKGLLKGLEDLEFGRRVETIQMTALMRTARIPRRVLETWGDLLLLKLQRKIPSAITDVKNSKGVNNNKEMNQRRRKLMTKHKAPHPRDDVDRLYVSRREGGSGLPSLKTVWTQRYNDSKTTYKGTEED